MARARWHADVDRRVALSVASGEPLTADAFFELARLLGRNHVPALLSDLFSAGRLTPEVLRAVLPGVWSGAEWPETSLGRALWVAWFRLADYPRPRRSIILFRGARPRYARGMAWTRDKDRASWFAQRWAAMTGTETTCTKSRLTLLPCSPTSML